MWARGCMSATVQCLASKAYISLPSNAPLRPQAIALNTLTSIKLLDCGSVAERVLSISSTEAAGIVHAALTCFSIMASHPRK